MNGLDRVKGILSQEKDKLAFIIGNGLNLYFNNNVSWKDLLLKLWRKFVKEDKRELPNGVSFPEFYEILQIRMNIDSKSAHNAVSKEVQTIMMNWQPNEKQNTVLNYIKEKDAPILTTNFDDLIPKSLKLKFIKMQEKGFNDVYPWPYYYSDKVLVSPTSGFGVWYINGMIKYHRSIRLGLCDYMGSVQRARKLIHKTAEQYSFLGKDQHGWPGYRTWLHILFNKSLFIFGLGLKESEVFLRWVLIERAKYYNQYPDRKYSGWYITTKKENNSDKGKKFFLESLGIEVIELDSYQDIYEKIWLH